MEEINNIELVIEEAHKIINDDFINYVNKREFELKITDLAKKVNINKINEEDIKKQIESNLPQNKPLAFVIFFTFFTVYRRHKYGKLSSFCDEYISKFSEYEITEHIDILNDYTCNSNSNTYYALIKRTEKLINKDGYKFKEHAGVLNLYIELVCSYYERNLDLRSGKKDKDHFDKALEYIENINKIIKENYEKDYYKFHLNKGRLLILLGKYDNGEDEIISAINMIDLSPDRENRVNLCEQYLTNASFIRAYDLNDENYKDLEKIKVNNYKLVALMTTLLGFLLGTINIFVETKEPKNLALLMLAYLSLLLVLVGVILLGLSITFKERKKVLFAYDISLILVGVILFIVAMLIIIL